MRSVMENDKDVVNDGKVIAESISQGLGGFTPDLMFNNMVKDFQRAKQLYGETIIREVTDFDQDYIEKNLNIPEFKSTLKQNIERNIAKLKEDGLLDREGQLTQKALKLASLILYTEELDKLTVKGMGEREERRRSRYGDKKDYKPYTSGTRYKDLALRHSVRTAARRGHNTLTPQDLSVYERRRKGKISIIYALDASGSMRGKKLATAKKAGIALAFKAIEQKNKAGLIVFSSDIETSVAPTTDFMHLLTELSQIRANRETDLQLALSKALELFPKSAETK
ncbi:MAG: VWA domain-containing protein, partial [Nitrosarchaeum sp.]|nr:VWA domain-containing protein [Nitrosarchaeum sp.]